MGEKIVLREKIGDYDLIIDKIDGKFTFSLFPCSYLTAEQLLLLSDLLKWAVQLDKIGHED